MYKEKTFLGVITARGGSKRIPDKALQYVLGRSLLGTTILTAQKSKYLDRTILSSDSWKIIKHAELYKCEAPFIRPSFLADDTTPSADVLIHAIERLKYVGYTYDYIVLLQPTSPLRAVVDIDETIKLCIDSNAPACVSVNEPKQSPFLCFSLDDSSKLYPLIDIRLAQGVRGQDLPKAYCVNGAVYVAETSWFMTYETFVTTETVAYIMPTNRSIDIDVWEDLYEAEEIARR